MGQSVKKDEKEGAVKPTSFKLSNESRELLKLVSEKMKRSQAKALEFLIEEAAKKEKLIK